MSFFEMSFEEFCATFKTPAALKTLQILWRTEAQERFERIKASNHYHNGVPCREFHAFPNMELPS